jgi:hypothetical protein
MLSVMLTVVMLSAIMLSTVMLSDTFLRGIMLRVIILTVIMLTVKILSGIILNVIRSIVVAPSKPCHFSIMTNHLTFITCCGIYQLFKGIIIKLAFFPFRKFLSFTGT